MSSDDAHTSTDEPADGEDTDESSLLPEVRGKGIPALPGESGDEDTADETEDDDDDAGSSRPDRWNVTEDGTPPEADPEILTEMLEVGEDAGKEIDELEEKRTVNIVEGVDEDEFFGLTSEETPSIATRYDLEKAVPMAKKLHFVEQQRYWVNEPYAFVSIFESVKENEKKYYVIEPYQNEIEEDIIEFFSRKLRTAIKYDNSALSLDGDAQERKDVIADKSRELLDRYNLYDPDSFFTNRSGADEQGFIDRLKSVIGMDDEEADFSTNPAKIDGMDARPEHAIISENKRKLSSYQVEKVLYYLKRNFVGYERIDPIKYDINVEDISCDGYNQPVFVYHSDYEQIITNVVHEEPGELDDFVVKLAQRSGKGISKREPQVDATLPDGSRAQLTLGAEVSDHGTNYTIRQFKDIPFTPIDLINWNTFSLNQMAFLWLCIENHKSLIFAGGTASGKTTSLNAVSLFIPSNTKIVSIEDTREVELPQRNWVASVTRPSFSGEDKGDIDEFDLLEAALRQRPDYIVMGEIRGEEGRTLFQVMSTGHTTYTTFHADDVGEVIKRFTTDPINVSKTLFTALDLVSIQTQTRIAGRKVRRSKNITEINDYSAEYDEINVEDVYEWVPEEDEFEPRGRNGTVQGTATLEEIQFDRGWSEKEVWEELKKRELVLAYLIKHEISTYAEVAATIQAFINDPETILTLIANEELEESLENLREMESVSIDVDPEDEKLVPRPEPSEEMIKECNNVLDETSHLVEPFEGEDAMISDAMPSPTDVVDKTAVDAADLADAGDADSTSGTAADDSPQDSPELPSGEEMPELPFEEDPEDSDFEPVDDDSPGGGGAT